jgi:hypothetical protein
MDTEPHQRINGILDAALRAFQAQPHDPLTKFINVETGGIVITRDIAVYRLVPAWLERPFDMASPMPRRPR